MTMNTRYFLKILLGLLALLSSGCGFLAEPWLNDYESVASAHTLVLIPQHSALLPYATLLSDIHESAYNAAVFALQENFSATIIYIVGNSLPTMNHAQEAGFANTAAFQIHVLLKEEEAQSLAEDPADYFQTLQHENAHIIMESLHGPALTPLFLEGLAEAISDPNIHIQARYQWTSGLSLEGIMNLTPEEFYADHVAANYKLSGSFIRYLIDLYGLERVRLAYPQVRRDNYPEVISALFGLDFVTCVNDWQTYLLRYP
jgi:hypothetical protein